MNISPKDLYDFFTDKGGELDYTEFVVGLEFYGQMVIDHLDVHFGITKVMDENNNLIKVD